jgi:hypothetical protein
VQLAICWEPRVSGGTRRCRNLLVGFQAMGDKPTGAGNQQERPLSAEWVVGFVEGEGCFSVRIFRNRNVPVGLASPTGVRGRAR